MASLRVLLVEPFSTGSHRAWAEGLVRHSRHDVLLVAHEGSFWKWRMQGGALTLAEGVREAGRPDVLLVSDMVHVAALLGLARDVLADVPVVVYMHENQLTYPLPDDAAPDHTYAVTNWLSMAAADRVVFNSEYHRRSWFEAVPKLLRRFPDYRHSAFVDAVAARSAVLPVGIDARRLAGPVDGWTAERGEPPLVLWNHRWEYDKDPAACFAALRQLRDGGGASFRLAVAGQQFQTVPAEFSAAQRDFADELVQFGTLERAEYELLLRQADVVVSTARHDFFGLSVLEAAAAGACPVVPDRLSYPELLPASSLYDGGDAHALRDRLWRVLTDARDRGTRAAEAQAAALAYDWSVVAPQYDDLLADVAKS